MKLIRDEDAFVDISEMTKMEFTVKIGNILASEGKVDKEQILKIFDGYLEDKGIDGEIIKERRKIIEESVDQINKLADKTSDADELAEYMSLVILIRFAIDFSFYK